MHTHTHTHTHTDTDTHRQTHTHRVSQHLLLTKSRHSQLELIQKEKKDKY